MTGAFRLRDPRQFLALGFGSGLAPRAPGTAGTLAALPLVWGLSLLPLGLYLLAVGLAFLLGCWVCGATARAVGVHDHPAIVWDEFVGLAVTLIAVPSTPVALVLGVVLFRVFDILKPWPIRWLDRHVHGGLGIMLDDVIAAIPAAAILHGVLSVLD
ncbi:MAG: phosphatidylglycerophosphatase A [Arhodomonas sp.]|nr:phosphatidylglycerophosphatase A [Arhodomonas sp.]